jgi:hypothetical protein
MLLACMGGDMFFEINIGNFSHAEGQHQRLMDNEILKMVSMRD